MKRLAFLPFACLAVACGNNERPPTLSTVECGAGYALVNGECEPTDALVPASDVSGADAGDAGGDAAAEGGGSDSSFPSVGVGVLDGCMGSENVVFLRGQKGDITFEGSAAIHEGTMKWSGTNGSQAFNANVLAYAKETGLGSPWSIGFQMASQTTELVPGVYGDAGFTSSASLEAGVPGMSVQVSAKTCFDLTGSFQIHEVEFDRPDGSIPNVVKLVASFERVCPSSGTKVAGCIRWTHTP